MSDLALNPRAKLHVSRREGDLVAVTVTAPVRGRPLRVTPVTRDGEPRVVEVLARLAARAGAVDLDVDGATWDRLVDLGLLVPESAVSRPVRLRCSPMGVMQDLAASSDRYPPLPHGRGAEAGEDLPHRDREGAEAPGGDDATVPPLDRLRVAPSLRFEEAAAPLAAELAWIRVEHPDTPLAGLLSFPESERALLGGLVPGEAPAGLDAERTAALAAAGVLVDPEDDARRRAAWEAARAEAGQRLRRERYAVLRGLVHPVQLAGLRRYYRELVAEGYVRLGDGQVPLRYYAHNEPLARRLHAELAGLVGELAGEPVKPSYVYFASYLAGAVLAPHRDRAQCEISVSLQVDYAPEPDGVTPWPIRVEREAVSLGLGDALVYRGRELTHARDALPEGHASASIFFHYVPHAFAGSLD